MPAWEHLLSNFYHPKIRCVFCQARFPREHAVPRLAVCASCIAVNSACEHCGACEGVAPHLSNTSYHYEGKPGWDDPNRPHFLCVQCAEEDTAHWDEMWAEYRAACM
jgi:hypothetical protein